MRPVRPERVRKRTPARVPHLGVLRGACGHLTGLAGRPRSVPSVIPPPRVWHQPTGQWRPVRACCVGGWGRCVGGSKSQRAVVHGLGPSAVRGVTPGRCAVGLQVRVGLLGVGFGIYIGVRSFSGGAWGIMVSSGRPLLHGLGGWCAEEKPGRHAGAWAVEGEAFGASITCGSCGWQGGAQQRHGQAAGRVSIRRRCWSSLRWRSRQSATW